MKKYIYIFKLIKQHLVILFNLFNFMYFRKSFNLNTFASKLRLYIYIFFNRIFAKSSLINQLYKNNNNEPHNYFPFTKEQKAESKQLNDGSLISLKSFLKLLYIRKNTIVKNLKQKPKMNYILKLSKIHGFFNQYFT